MREGVEIFEGITNFLRVEGWGVCGGGEVFGNIRGKFLGEGVTKFFCGWRGRGGEVVGGLWKHVTIFIWGVRWSACVWPGQKTMAPTGFEPPQLMAHKKKFENSKKPCFVECD
jgi:hypothetical protein